MYKIVSFRGTSFSRYDAVINSLTLFDHHMNGNLKGFCETVAYLVLCSWIEPRHSFNYSNMADANRLEISDTESTLIDWGAKKHESDTEFTLIEGASKKRKLDKPFLQPLNNYLKNFFEKNHFIPKFSLHPGGHNYDLKTETGFRSVMFFIDELFIDNDDIVSFIFHKESDELDHQVVVYKDISYSDIGKIAYTVIDTNLDGYMQQFDSVEKILEMYKERGEEMAKVILFKHKEVS